MKRITVLGAGLSTTSLIKYLLEKSGDHNWQVRTAQSYCIKANSNISPGNPLEVKTRCRQEYFSICFRKNGNWNPAIRT
jgi:hypothetical protein